MWGANKLRKVEKEYQIGMKWSAGNNVLEELASDASASHQNQRDFLQCCHFLSLFLFIFPLNVDWRCSFRLSVAYCSFLFKLRRSQDELGLKIGPGIQTRILPAVSVTENSEMYTVLVWWCCQELISGKENDRTSNSALLSTQVRWSF